MLKGENAQVRIEVEDGPPPSLLLVLDRRTDCFLTPWQDAFALAQTMELAAGDIRDYSQVHDHAAVVREQAQVRLGHKGPLVAIVFEWTDRVRFGWESALLVAAAIRKVAQDAHLEEEKAVHLVYNRRGHIKRLFNRKTGNTQHIPGR